jgi:hypothetical protein
MIMKRLISSLTLILFALTCFSQYSLLTVFSEEGETFYLYVDGEKMNETPMSNINNIRLVNDYHRIKVVGASDRSISVSKNQGSRDMDDNYCRLTLCLKQNRSGKYKLRMTNFTPIPEEEFYSQQPDDNTGEVVYVEETTKPVTSVERKKVVRKSTTTTENSNVSVTVNAEKNSEKSGKSESVSMNLNVSEDGNSASLSLNVSASGSSSGKTVVTESSSEETVVINGGTTTSTSITTEETITINGGTSNSSAGNTTVVESHPMPGYNGTIGCRNVIWDREMKDIKRTISDKFHDESRLSVAKDIVKRKCLQAKHVRDIMKLFDHEGTRLKFAKAAYANTYDQDNFYIVYNELDFDVSVNELKAFINGEDTDDFEF